MQTFLPYDNFVLSAEALDNSRLGKQRVEVLQILKAIIDGEGWIYHPATHMWRGHTNALFQYGLAICDEWLKRGKVDTCRDKIRNYFSTGLTNALPPWFGMKNFHASHRSNLLRKDAVYYSKFGWTEEPDLPYCWPIKREDGWCMRFKHAGAKNYEVEYKLL